MLLEQAESQYPNESLAEVTDFEAEPYDTQPAAQVGLNGDFLASARLDNLLSCYVGLQALLNARTDRPSSSSATTTRKSEVLLVRGHGPF